MLVLWQHQHQPQHRTWNEAGVGVDLGKYDVFPAVRAERWCWMSSAEPSITAGVDDLRVISPFTNTNPQGLGKSWFQVRCWCWCWWSEAHEQGANRMTHPRKISFYSLDECKSLELYTFIWTIIFTLSDFWSDFSLCILYDEILLQFLTDKGRFHFRRRDFSRKNWDD